MRRPEHYYRQSGVVPFRRDGERVEILLITSLRRGRWIIPKGIVEPHLSPEESAAREAEEEAGVRGRVLSPSIGAYEHRKWGGTCRVEVFLLEVRELLEDWPEAGARRRRWVPLEKAGRLVRSEGLRGVLARLPDALPSRR